MSTLTLKKGLLVFIVLVLFLTMPLTGCRVTPKLTAILLLRDGLPYNTHYENSARLAIDTYQGSVENPVNIELISVIYDPNSSRLPEEYLEMIQKYNPDIVIGSIISGDVIKIKDAINQSKVPFITMGTATELTANGNQFILRASASDRILNQIAIKYCVEVLGAKRFGLVHSNTVFGNGAKEDITTILRKYNLDIKTTISFGLEVTKEELASNFNEINKEDLDIVLLWPDFGQFPVFYEAMQITPLNTLFMGNQAFLSVNELESYTFNIDNNYVLGHYIYLPTNSRFSDQMAEKFGKRPLIKETPAVYDIMNHIIFACSTMDGDITPDNLLAALKSEPFQGIISLYQYKENGEGVGQIYIGQIKSGNVVFRKIEVIE